MSFALTHLIGFGAVAAASGTPYSETSATPSSPNTLAGNTMFAREWAINNGATINTIGIFSNSAATITMKIALRDSATQYTVVVSESFSHPGGGWADKTLSTPYTVPGSGTYHAGAYSAATVEGNTTTARAYKLNGDYTGTITGMTEDSSNTPAMRVSGTI